MSFFNILGKLDILLTFTSVLVYFQIFTSQWPSHLKVAIINDSASSPSGLWNAAQVKGRRNFPAKSDSRWDFGKPCPNLHRVSSILVVLFVYSQRGMSRQGISFECCVIIPLCHTILINLNTTSAESVICVLNWVWGEDVRCTETATL